MRLLKDANGFLQRGLFPAQSFFPSLWNAVRVKITPDRENWPEPHRDPSSSRVPGAGQMQAVSHP